MNRAPSSAAELGRRTPNTPRPSGVPSTSPTGCNPPAAVTADNRALYREKFARVVPLLAPVLDVTTPAGGFYLWPHVGGDDEDFTRALYAAQNITILPGSYLARAAQGVNPGAGRVRISLVAGVDECIEAARRIRAFIQAR